MTISQDLFMAILSMDSYNRGYDAGIMLEDNSIGYAAVEARDSYVDDATYQNCQESGFYAVAYQWNGETVISHRGTDNANPRPWDPFLRLSTQCGTWMDQGMDPRLGGRG